MSLDDVVQLTITTATIFPTRAGFGVPLFLVLHTVTPNLVDEYASNKEMTDAGWVSTSPGYLGVQKIFSQNPRPTKVVIGKRTRAYTQVIRLIPVKTTQNFHYKFQIVDPAGVVTQIDYTVPGAATVASICAALQALIDPVTDLVATDNTTHVTCTTTAGKLVNYRSLPKPVDMKVQDMSTNPGIESDLADIEAVDDTSWYGVLVDHAGPAAITAAAVFVEARRKLALFNTSDSDILVAGSGDIASTQKAAAYARSGLLHSATEVQCYSAHAWMGKVLPTDPGATTWAYQTLAGVTVDAYTGAQKTQLKLKNCNYNIVIGGLNSTTPGKSSSGEFLDVTHFVDWLYARTQERVFGTIKAASDRGSKIPYTDSGVDIIRADILAQLQEGINQGGLTSDPAPTVQAPKVKDVAAADRAARLLPNITFQAYLAGAIHAVKISGTLSV